MNKITIIILSFIFFASNNSFASNRPNTQNTPFYNSFKINNKPIHIIKFKNSIQSSDLRIEQFGSIESGESVEINVTENIASFLLSGIMSNTDENVGVFKIINPNNETIYELDISNGLENITVISDFTNTTLGNTGEFAMMMPMLPNGIGSLKTGKYHITLLSAEGNTINNVKVVFKNKTQMSQKIDLNVLFINSNQSFSNVEYLNSFFGNIKKELNKLLNPHNLSIGTLNYKISNQQIAQQYENMNESQEETSEICSKVSDEFGNNRAVNIAFVSTLTFDDIDGRVDGYSPSDPGSFMDANSRLNCVFIAKEGYGESTVMTAELILHEVAHYQSLPHSSEEDGLSFDYFTDTPQCDAATYDTNNDGIITDTECGNAGGANNFMFYSGIENFAPFEVSQQQAEIIKSNPYFYPESSGIAIDATTSGGWFNPEQSGHGFFVEILSGNRMLATWYVFDQNGNQVWLIGLGSINGLHATLDVTYVENGVFPPNFNPNDVTRSHWGTFEFDLVDCNNMIVSWQSEIQGYDSGNLELTRLTSIDTLSCNQ